MAIRRLGQILVDLGFITDEQLEMLLEEQEQRPGELLGKIAEEMALITDEQLSQALAEQMHMQVVNLSEIELNRDVLATITDTMAQLYRVIPVMLDDRTLTLATCDPQNLAIQDELRNFLGYDIRLVVATEGDVKRALDRYYASESESIETILTELEGDDELKQAVAAAIGTHGPVDLTSVEALADSAPVRKLLNIQRQLPPAVWQREVDRFEHNLRASVRRLQDLVSVAQSVEKMDSIVAAARRLGFACEPPQLQLHAGDKLVGWRLVLSSP